MRGNRRGAVSLVVSTALACAAASSPASALAQGEQADSLLDEAQRLNKEALRHLAARRLDEALPLARRVVDLCQKALGRESATCAPTLNNLAEVLRAKADYAAAEPHYRRALALQERELGPAHPDVAVSLDNLASMLFEKGDYAAVEPLFRRALAIRVKALGAEHPDVATTLNNLAELSRERGDYAAAEALYRRALAIWEKRLGPGHPNVALALGGLARTRSARGDYAGAEALDRRALELVQKALGVDHPDVALRLHNLATVLIEKGDYAAAEPVERRALAIREKALGADHPDIASYLNNLASLLSRKGDDVAAEALFRRALAIREKALGKDHADVASSLNNLATLLYTRRDYAGAERLTRRALAIDEKVLGKEHPRIASFLRNLAEFLDARGDHAGAERLQRRALALSEKVLGVDHPEVAMSLSNLAASLRDRGDLAGAEPLYRRALAIREKALGPEHPDVATSLINLATLLYARGDLAAAEPLYGRAADIQDRNALRLLGTGSVRQKQAYFATLRKTTACVISFHAQGRPASDSSLRLALRTLLRRKGLAAEIGGAGFRAVAARASAADRDKLAALQDRRAELSRRAWSGPDPRVSSAENASRLTVLEDEIEKLERELSARYAELRIAHVPVTVDSVQAALPTGSALVEYAVYEPLDPKAPFAKLWGPAEYVAYVLPASGKPRFARLGPAAAIDAAIHDYRASVSNLGADVDQRAGALYALVVKPVRELLGRSREVYVAPDGALQLVPFAALMDEKGRYLIQDLRVNLLTSGRDTLRFQDRVPPRSPALVFGGPDYGSETAPAATADPSRGMRSTDLGTLTFPQLPGTLVEAKALARLLPGSTLLTGRDATEAALKSSAAPSIVHIATHGFFLPDLTAPGDPTGASAAADAALPEDPMLRAGLVFEGANRRRSGTSDDGILTALEATSLDLRGTQLVVLSACETGLGRVNNGDGVYGLRRALVVSGAETQVMSLWSVDDAVTQRLMVGYYRRLRRGAGRIDALRDMQLALLADPRTAHPFYWASFIGAGDPTPLHLPRPGR